MPSSIVFCCKPLHASCKQHPVCNTRFSPKLATLVLQVLPEVTPKITRGSGKTMYQ